MVRAIRLFAVAGLAALALTHPTRAQSPAPVAMLGLGGGGVLALIRRVRALLWAGAGLALYPRIKPKQPTA